MTTITFTAWGDTFNATPTFGRYPNGRLAIRLVSEFEEPLLTLTTNLPDQHLNEGEVFIKNWAENEPAFHALMHEGWLTHTGREVGSGYIEPPACLLAGPLLTAYEEWMKH